MDGGIPAEHSRATNVCAVVVTFRRPVELRACVQALLEQQPAVSTVVVVDNGGSEAASLARDSRVLVVDPGDNVGPAGGFAVGIDKALELGATWLYLMNDDDRPRPGTLQRLLTRVDIDPSPTTIGAIGAWVQSATAIRPLGEARRGGRFIAQPERHSGAIEYETDAAVFSGLLVRAAVVRDVGNVRRDLFMMGEEHEFCTRLRLAGWRIVMLAEPLVDLQLHDEGGINPPWRGYYSARNSVHLLRSIPDRRLADWLHLLWRQTKFMVAAFALPHPGRRVRLRMLGLLHGLRGITGRRVEPR